MSRQVASGRLASQRITSTRSRHKHWMACWQELALMMRQPGSAKMRRSASWSSREALMQRIFWSGAGLRAFSGMKAEDAGGRGGDATFVKAAPLWGGGEIGGTGPNFQGRGARTLRDDLDGVIVAIPVAGKTQGVLLADVAGDFQASSRDVL